MAINCKGRMLLAKECGNPEDDLKYIQELYDYNESALLQEHDHRKRSLEIKIARDANEDGKAHTRGFYQDEIFLFKENLPKIMRYALFMATMSITESSIVLLCQASSKILGLKEFKKPRSNVIINGIEYLQKRVKIDLSKKPDKICASLEALPSNFTFPDDIKDRIHYNESKRCLVFKGIMTNKDKEKLLRPYDSYTKAIEELFSKSPVGLIEDLRKVRNCITHENGILDNGRNAEDIKKFVARNKRIINIDKNDNSLILHKNFVAKMSQKVINLIGFLRNLIAEKIDSRIPEEGKK